MDPPNATADIKRVVKTQPHKTRAAELKPSSTMYQPAMTTGAQLEANANPFVLAASTARDGQKKPLLR